MSRTHSTGSSQAAFCPCTCNGDRQERVLTSFPERKSCTQQFSTLLRNTGRSSESIYIWVGQPDREFTEYYCLQDAFLGVISNRVKGRVQEGKAIPATECSQQPPQSTNWGRRGCERHYLDPILRSLLKVGDDRIIPQVNEPGPKILNTNGTWQEETRPWKRGEEVELLVQKHQTHEIFWPEKSLYYVTLVFTMLDTSLLFSLLFSF